MITIDDLSLWIKENTALSDSSIYKYSRAVNTISNEMQQKGIIPVGLFDMSVLQCDFYLPIKKVFSLDFRTELWYCCVLQRRCWYVTNDCRRNLQRRKV